MVPTVQILTIPTIHYLPILVVQVLWNWVAETLGEVVQAAIGAMEIQVTRAAVIVAATVVAEGAVVDVEAVEINLFR